MLYHHDERSLSWFISVSRIQRTDSLLAELWLASLLTAFGVAAGLVCFSIETEGPVRLRNMMHSASFRSSVHGYPVHGHPIHGLPIHGKPVPGYDILTDTKHMKIVWHQHDAIDLPWWGAPLFCFYLMNRTIHRTIHLTPFYLEAGQCHRNVRVIRVRARVSV